MEQESTIVVNKFRLEFRRTLLIVAVMKLRHSRVIVVVRQTYLFFDRVVYKIYYITTSFNNIICDKIKLCSMTWDVFSHSMLLLFTLLIKINMLM